MTNPKPLKSKKFVLVLCKELLDNPQSHSYSYDTIDLKQTLLNLSSKGINPFEILEKDVYDSHFDMEDLNIQNVTLQSTDQVYLFPETKIPRYKFKEKSDEVGFKARRDINKCNIAVIDQKSLDHHKKCLKGWGVNSLTYVSRDQFYKFNSHLEDSHNFDIFSLLSQEDASSLVKQFEDTSFYLFMDSPSNILLRKFGTYFEFDYGHSSFHKKESLNSAQTETIEKLAYLSTCNITITSSDCILKQITGEVELDDKMLKRLDQMLKSDDASVELAMETLTNLNYDKKLFELMMLINTNSSRMRYSKVFNNISFKSFRSSLDALIPRYCKDYFFTYVFHYSDYIQLLGSIKRLEKRHIDYFEKEIKEDFKHLPMNKFFRIEKITANETLVEYLRESKENMKNLNLLDEVDEVKEDVKD